MEYSKPLIHNPFQFEPNQECTLHISNLDQKVNEKILWELFIQCSPVLSVFIPKDKVTKIHQGFGFVVFQNENDCDYAFRIMNLIKLYGKPIKISKASSDKKIYNIGANIYVGNLPISYDERLIRNVFSNFGTILNLKIIKQENKEKQHVFIDYSSFEESDNSIKEMNNQIIAGKKIVVEYAYKPNSNKERYGSIAERLLAREDVNKKNMQK
jgi:splicing factor 3B subunit 4